MSLTACEYCGFRYVAMGADDPRCAFCGQVPKTRHLAPPPAEGTWDDLAQHVGSPGSLGEALFRLRRMNEWPLRQLSKRCGIPKSTLSRYERGTQVPNLSRLRKISTALALTSGQWHRLVDLIAKEEQHEPVQDV